LFFFMLLSMHAVIRQAGGQAGRQAGRQIDEQSSVSQSVSQSVGRFVCKPENSSVLCMIVNLLGVL
jgi:hypothetical protein